MRTAALYIRVSTEDQTEYSPEAQRKAMVDYAKRNDMIVSEQYIYVDAGISGRKAERRPAFMRMIAEAKKKPRPFDVILVHKFDRFARNREDSIVYKSLLRKECGIQVISITEHIEDDKFSVILESMLEAMAEYYSLNLADEVKKGMTEKALRGEVQSCAAYGYSMEDGKLILNPETAPIVKNIYNDYLSGKSVFAIARSLNECGIKTSRGNRFEKRTITYILENPLYYGYVRWNPTGKSDIRVPKNKKQDFIIAKGNHEPIIDKETYDKVQEKLNYEYHPRTRPYEYRMHWLSGMLFCSSCGHVLVASKNGFQCSYYSKGICLISHFCMREKMERAVLDAMKSVIDGGEYKQIPPRHINHTTELTSLRNELRKLDFKAARIRDAYENGIDTIEEYKANKQRISDEQKRIKDKIDEFERETQAVLGESPDAFRKRLQQVYEILISDADKDTKQAALKTAVDKIIYDKTTETLDIYYVCGNYMSLQ